MIHLHGNTTIATENNSIAWDSCFVAAVAAPPLLIRVITLYPGLLDQIYSSLVLYRLSVKTNGE